MEHRSLSPHSGCSGGEESAGPGCDLEEPDEREGDLIGGCVEGFLNLVEAGCDHWAKPSHIYQHLFPKG
jgi:hypothetical protein